MTTVIGVTCLYSMINLPAYLHLCESAEALGSIVPATGYPELINLLLTYLHKEQKGPHGAPIGDVTLEVQRMVRASRVYIQERVGGW